MKARMRVLEFADARFVEASFSRAFRRSGPSAERPACENPDMDPIAPESQRYNHFGQPIGAELPGWKAPPSPPHVELAGRYCSLLPLNAARHARDLFEAQREDQAGERWTYLFHGPYTDFATYEKWCTEVQASRDPQFYAVVDAADGRAAGSAAYMRIEPRHGVIEVGNIYLA